MVTKCKLQQSVHSEEKETDNVLIGLFDYLQMISTSQTQIVALVGFLSLVSYIFYRYTSTSRERSTRNVIETTTESYSVTTKSDSAESSGIYQRNVVLEKENIDEKVDKVHNLLVGNTQITTEISKLTKKHEKPQAPVAPTPVLKKFGINDPDLEITSPKPELKPIKTESIESHDTEQISVIEELPKLEIIEESTVTTSKSEAATITAEKKESQSKEETKEVSSQRKKGKLEKTNSILELFKAKHVHAIEDHFNDLNEISVAIKQAGLEKSQLIFGIDFTISNLENGTNTFNGRSLHNRDDTIMNPYQKVIQILGKTLEAFDTDGRIPAFGFGDSKTKDRRVFPFASQGYCDGFKDVLDRYNEVLKTIQLSGPTNFAPLIKEAIKIVKQTKQYHILVIVADGQVTNERQTREAIVDASNYPISIIMVGVGDGPWDTMNEFDDSLPKRQFDNFQFVNYHEVTSGSDNPDELFALHTLMEIPDQYKCIKELDLLSE